VTQRQWDVLHDAEGVQGPKWDELNSAEIVSRVCEIP
jgi:hypothetical protein